MKIKRTLAALAAAAIVAAGFTACGDSSSSEGKGTVKVNDSVAQTDAPAETNAPAETDAPAETNESTEDPASEGKTYEHIFTADKAKIKYNGTTFGTGDNIEDIKASLGSEAAPSTDATSCLTGNTIKEYYFNGLTIQANASGAIFSITLSNDLYAGGDGTTADGVKVGDDEDTIKTALGEPDETNKSNLIYKDGNVSLQVTLSKKGGADVIWVSDPSVEG